MNNNFFTCLCTRHFTLRSFQKIYKLHKFKFIKHNFLKKQWVTILLHVIYVHSALDMPYQRASKCPESQIRDEQQWRDQHMKRWHLFGPCIGKRNAMNLSILNPSNYNFCLLIRRHWIKLTFFFLSDILSNIKLQ